jgi:hypothetical protein
MAGGNSDEFKNLLTLSVNGQRFRGNDASEILVNCIVPECTIKERTYRKMAIHYNEEHRSHLVLGMRCNFCEWKCSESLRCFTSHMSQQHNKPVYMDTELPLEAVRKYYVDHTPICSKMRSDLIALNKKLKSEQKRAATVLRKAAKLAAKVAAKVPVKKCLTLLKKATPAKVKKDTLAIPAEILLTEHAEETNNIVTIDEEKSLDEFFDNETAQIRGGGPQVGNNVIVNKPEERTTTLTRKNMETQTEDDDEDDDDDEYYNLSSDEEDGCPSSDDDDTPFEIISSKAFIERVTKERENKRKISSDEDELEVLQVFKKRQIFTYKNV